MREKTTLESTEGGGTKLERTEAEYYIWEHRGRTLNRTAKRGDTILECTEDGH